MRRGRLKSIDLLPAAADVARERAIAAIVSRRGSQLAVLAAMNDELDALGIKPISHSAFNRWVIDGLERGFARRGVSVCPACGRPLDGKAQQ